MARGSRRRRAAQSALAPYTQLGLLPAKLAAPFLPPATPCRQVGVVLETAVSKKSTARAQAPLAIGAMPASLSRRHFTAAASCAYSHAAASVSAASPLTPRHACAAPLQALPSSARTRCCFQLTVSLSGTTLQLHFAARPTLLSWAYSVLPCSSCLPPRRALITTPPVPPPPAPRPLPHTFHPLQAAPSTLPAPWAPPSSAAPGQAPSGSSL